MKCLRIKQLLLSLILATAMTSSIQAEELKLSAGGGPLDSVINPVKGAFEKETGIKINILFGNATLGFKQLYKGDSDVSAAGSSFEDVLTSLKKEGFEVKDPAAYQHETVGRGMIHTIVNNKNPVLKLSKDQLKGIFTGKITNWKEVGGNDLPILVVLSTINPATSGTFSKIILDKEPYTKEVIEQGRFEELKVTVEANPEAIAFGSLTILGPEVKKVETPEISRPIILITKGAPAPKVQKLIDFIKGPGKGLVKE